jgi:hypothetical protein
MPVTALVGKEGTMTTTYPTPDRSSHRPNLAKTPENDVLDLVWNVGHLSDRTLAVAVV